MSETKTAVKKTAKPKAEKAPAQHATEAPLATGSVIIKGKPLSTRGRTFIGVVISNRMTKTVTVEWERRKYVTKFQRYEKRRTRVKAHDEMGCEIGDIVEIVETRPISKTKNFLVTKIITRAA